MAEHWRSEDDADGIRWLSLDKADSTTNVLSRRVLAELRDLVEAIAADPPSGVVIRSAKASGFILGADITEFEHVTGVEEAEALAREGQALFARLEALPCPTVAAISGFALGGGLELALACDYRVAAQSYERSIGLPEVQLGIHPGFGGTVRSVRLLGAPLAMDLMLTGRSVSPVEALRAGLVDELAEPARLDQAARRLLRRRPPKRRAPLYLRLLDLKPCRFWLGRRLRARVAGARPASTTLPPMRSWNCGCATGRRVRQPTAPKPVRSPHCSSARRPGVSCACSFCANAFGHVPSPPRASNACTSWVPVSWGATSRPGAS